MVRVPVRAPPLFAATLNPTEPLPLPDAPLAIVIHDAFEAAAQAQSAPLVTATAPVPPGASNVWDAGEIAYEHAGAAAGCVTVSVWSAIVSVPDRAAPAFALAL